MKWLKLLLVSVSLLLLYSCVQKPPPEPDYSCIPNKEGASVLDFVGTWIARRSIYPEVTDKLIIRANGTYKQIIHIEISENDYESEWLSWRISYNDRGIMYLYMEGYTLCGYYRTESCEPEVDCARFFL